MMRWTLALPFVLVACGNAVAQTDRPKVPADLPFHPDLKTPPVPEPKPAAEAAPPIATPAPAPGKAALPFPIVPPVLDRVWFDAPGDGAVWAVGRTYKAAFTADGAVYHPFFGPRAPRHFPVTFALAGLRRGGVPLAVPGTSVPSRDGERILYDRGAALEVYEPRLEGVEQSFVIHDLPGAGALEVLVGVRTELAASDDTEGLRFEGAFGHVRYGKATASTRPARASRSPPRSRTGPSASRCRRPSWPGPRSRSRSIPWSARTRSRGSARSPVTRTPPTTTPRTAIS